MDAARASYFNLVSIILTPLEHEMMTEPLNNLHPCEPCLKFILNSDPIIDIDGMSWFERNRRVFFGANFGRIQKTNSVKKYL